LLRALFDVFIVRKIGVPDYEEFARAFSGIASLPISPMIRPKISSRAQPHF
jgi:predicted phosphoribosyltransferase